MPRHTHTQTVVYRSANVAQLADVRLKIQGPGGFVERPLPLGSLTLGSDPNGEVVVDDAAVSRRHCVVQLSENGVSVRDCGSKNGTHLGTARIVEAFIEPGDVLMIGDSKLWIEVGPSTTEIPLGDSQRLGELLGTSLPMRALFGSLQKALKSDATVLLQGETGTGKDAVSRTLHALGPRADGPYVVCDCGALARELIEAELFGHTKGAFSGATQSRVGLLQAAHTGTLFLDEIGELPLELQPRLLRALESRRLRPVGANTDLPIDIRIIAATHRDLRAAVKQGTFREDLFYRLAILEVRLPPLRERVDDIPLLVEHFLKKAQPDLKMTDLPAGVLPMLKAHAWPGNLRELRNVVERLALTRQVPELAATMAESLTPWHEARAEAIAKFEAQHIARALALTEGNHAAAARLLGVSRQLVHQLSTRYQADSSQDASTPSSSRP